ncbi:ABC-type cobalt transport system, ATPase component [Desulfitobacterium dehalogenans ATCC 51507]|uniref:ABC-type cobalt transport system, ATPase component n=1 Tax=Desulfitobacterium dehalogenans (strain ATCC 51507 / DSM 9161 / JW/IU-DC1) TaxID=756499 RepID=I4A7K9_DESDJ|nr:ABC transporter ATP-binding protein [Desulfitobacterium dehalogenans]AFL99943.1 ABC-type cobalt transport system, ATPase component [Desulfitobacterium dehalogenans ATCC 51507]
MSDHELEVKNLHFSYPDGHEAIKDISFTIYQGESVGIIGANGSGKSTLLSLIMGVLFPDKGEVKVGDITVTKKTLSTIRQRVGMVFQDPDDQLFMTTVFDDVAFGPRNYHLDEEEVKIRVEEALAMVGIPHLIERAPFKLSGGEKRAAAIASVLSMKPDTLIMDEPTTGLDPKSRRRLINILNGFNQTRIITSHDLDMVLETCERILIIKDGEVAASGTTSEILKNGELLEQCGLEIPLSLHDCPVCGTMKGGKR